MEKKPRTPGRIAARDLPPVKAWALPKIRGGHVVRSPFKEKNKNEAAGAVSSGVVEELDVPEPLTVEAVENIRRQAHEEGLAKGYQEGFGKGEQEGRTKGEQLGYEAGLKQGEAEINRLRQQLGALIRAVEQPLTEQQDQLEAALLRLVVDTAEAVVGQQLSTRPELLSRTVAEAVASLPHGEQELSFSVHPEDLAALEEIKAQEHASWTLRGDAAMQVGGIRIRGANSYVDYSVEQRFSQVAREVLNRTSDEDDPATDNGAS